MEKEKLHKLLRIGLIVLISSAIIVCLILTIINKNSSTNQLTNKVEKKQDFLILFTEDEKKCGSFCTEALNIADYYEKNYGLEFIIYDVSKEGEKNYKNLSKELYGTNKPSIVYPSCVIVMDGKVKSVSNMSGTEVDFRKNLYSTGYLKNEYEHMDEQIRYEDFEDIYEKDEKSLIVLYTYDDASFDYRSTILELAKNNNFNYYVLDYRFVDGNDIGKDIKDANSGTMKSPSMIIVENEEVIDYNDSTKKEDIEKFLKTNKIIK